MISRGEILVDAIIASVVGGFLAFFALRLVPIPNNLYGLGYVFAWICCSLVIFLCLLFIGQWKVPREYPEDHKKRNLEEYEIPEIESDSSPWMEKHVLSADTGKEYQKGRVYTVLEQRPLTLPIILGGLMVLPIPIVSIVAKFVMCDYGLGTDLGGVYLFLPMFLISAIVLAAIAGLVGKGLGLLLGWLTKARSAHVIGTAVGSLLAVAIALYIGFFASAFFMFPNC